MPNRISDDQERMVLEAYFVFAFTVEETAAYAGVDKMTASKYWGKWGLEPLHSTGRRKRVTDFPEGYVNANEASRRAECSRSKISDYFKDGKLKGYKEGRHLWISLDSLKTISPLDSGKL